MIRMLDARELQAWHALESQDPSTIRAVDPKTCAALLLARGQRLEGDCQHAEHVLPVGDVLLSGIEVKGGLFFIVTGPRGDTIAQGFAGPKGAANV